MVPKPPTSGDCAAGVAARGKGWVLPVVLLGVAGAGAAAYYLWLKK
jgi:hypothetical protein